MLSPQNAKSKDDNMIELSFGVATKLWCSVILCFIILIVMYNSDKMMFID